MTEYKAIVLSGDTDAYQEILLGKELPGFSIKACLDVGRQCPTDRTAISFWEPGAFEPGAALCPISHG